MKRKVALSGALAWGAFCKLKIAGCWYRTLVSKMSVPYLPAPSCDNHPVSSAGPWRAASLRFWQQWGRRAATPTPDRRAIWSFFPGLYICWAKIATPFGMEVVSLPGYEDRGDGPLAESERLPKGKRWVTSHGSLFYTASLSQHQLAPGSFQIPIQPCWEELPRPPENLLRPDSDSGL